MQPLIYACALALLLCLSTEAAAQPSPNNTTAPQSQCVGLYLPLNAKVTVTLKTKRKLKGKLAAIRPDEFELAQGSQIQTIACADASKVERQRGFVRQLKYTFGASLAAAGLAIALPGLIVVKVGAEDVGLVIASPGLLLFAGGLDLAEWK